MSNNSDKTLQDIINSSDLADGGKLKEAYKMVYEDMVNSGCGLIIGKYDARNGNLQYMYGISTVMEWIAYRGAGEEEADRFSDMFAENMVKSEEKSE